MSMRVISNSVNDEQFKQVVTIGADPELFLINSAGKFISSIGLIGGSKRKPRDIGEGCAVQEDNVAVEYNIAPSSTVEEFVKYNTYALETIAREALEKNLFLSITASKVFDEDQLANRKARTFGCDPDFNAWTGKMNERPGGVHPNLRSAGGHIHFGCQLDRFQLIRWSDVLLGLNSVLEDDDTQRRQLYGQAGCFRPKPYGAEYRTLSNYWLRSTDMMKLVFERAQEVAQRVAAGMTLEDAAGEDIQTAINTSNRDMAASLIRQYA
jgi:hypothetical protein